MTHTVSSFVAHFLSGRALRAGPKEEVPLRRDTRFLRGVGIGLVVSALAAGSASAQVTPAAGYTPPDDTPVIRLGMTLFPTYTFQTEPKITDADGNTVSRNAFDVARAYINVTGNVSHIVAFRITPDITRGSGLFNPATGASITSDSLVFRIKYAYGQFNLDDWMARGSWARIGIQQTPWVDFEEGIYRYRFQGTVFAERIPLPTAMTSADAGVSFHYNLPSNYGDFHVGVYNGENYQRVEVNNQKALEFRGSVRPFATNTDMPVLRGLRAHLVYYDDHYAGDDERRRVMGNVTFEHQYLNASFDYLGAKDQTLLTASDVSSNGYSIWATPRLPNATTGASWEGLLRYDHWTPNTSSAFAPPATSPDATTTFKSQHQNRLIAGVAYWFPHPGGAPVAALLFDYDRQIFKNLTTAPTKSIAVHGLINF